MAIVALERNRPLVLKEVSSSLHFILLGVTAQRASEVGDVGVGLSDLETFKPELKLVCVFLIDPNVAHDVPVLRLASIVEQPTDNERPTEPGSKVGLDKH